MDAPRFDALARALSPGTSRRHLFAALSSGLLAAGHFSSGPDDVTAKRKKRKKKKK